MEWLTKGIPIEVTRWGFFHLCRKVKPSLFSSCEGQHLSIQGLVKRVNEQEKNKKTLGMFLMRTQHGIKLRKVDFK